MVQRAVVAADLLRALMQTCCVCTSYNLVNLHAVDADGHTTERSSITAAKVYVFKEDIALPILTSTLVVAQLSYDTIFF